MEWLRSEVRVFDIVVILVYLAASLILGFLGNKLLGLSGNKEDDYFLAGRKMPGWLNGLSNAATALNSDVAPLYCGVAVAVGLSGAWFYLSRFGFGMLIISLLFAVKWRQMRIRTGPEFFTLRYGRGSGCARVYSSIHTVLLGMIPWIGAGLVGMHKVSGTIFNYDNIWITIGVILPLLTIYVWSSGLGGVLITDGFQGVVIIIGNIVLVGAVLWTFGGPSGMGDALKKAYDSKDVRELKVLADSTGFYEFDVAGAKPGVMQIAVYPEMRSGYYGKERGATMTPATAEYSRAAKIFSETGEYRSIEKINGYTVEKTLYANTVRPDTFNGVKIKPLTPQSDGNILIKVGENTYTHPADANKNSDWLNTPQLRQEVADNANYGENLSSSLPVIGNKMLGPLAVMCWLIISVVGVGGGVASDGQRYFSCKSNYEAAKVGLWGNAALFGMLLLLMLPVLGMLAKYPEIHFITDAGLRENIYGRMLTEFLPTGAVGITVAAMLASVMSTVSTHLNYGSQTLLNDVYRPIFGEPAKGREVMVGRLLMLIIVALSIVVTVNTKSLMGITTVVVGLFGSSATFGWAQWWWWRVNLRGWIISIVSGPVFYLLFSYFLPKWNWWSAQMEANGETMGIVQAIIAMGLSMMCWLIVTLCTKPENMEQLKEFYLRARPSGCWGKVRKELIAEGRLEEIEAPSLLLPGFAIAIVGFVMMAAGTLAVAVLFIGDYRSLIAYFIITIITGFIFRRLFNWHLKRMGADVDFYVPIED